MIEATCTACGNVSHIPDGDVPVGAKFINCTTCKSRVALPAKPSAMPPPIPGGRDTGIGLADLPAPRRPSVLSADSSKPAPRSGLQAAGPGSHPDADLPAPRSARPSQGPPVSQSGSVELDLGPPGASDLAADLPAPKLTHRGLGPDVADLPAPRTTKPGHADLPAPKAKGLAPPPARASRPSAPPPVEFSDLPLPKPQGIIDLPTPKGPGTTEVAPKGFFDDLPQPANPNRQNAPELPAPKGFFDDLPQPAQQNKGTDVAPKGFFDDLPGKVHPSKAKPELPAPKGFFDDLPGKVNSNKPEVPAPKGFFDDLPQRSQNQGKQQGTDVAPKGFFDDLPQPTRGVKPSSPPDNRPLDLATASGPELDLSLEEPSAKQPSSYADLDLAKPSTPAALAASGVSGMRLDTPKRAPGQTGSPPLPTPMKFTPASGDLALELEEPHRGQGSSQKLGPKPQRREFVEKTSSGRGRTIALVVLLLLALGGGGFLVYQRVFSKGGADIEADLATARAAIAASDATHWDRAAVAARKVLESDKHNAEALGIAAEGQCGSALANGVGFNSKIDACSQTINIATTDSTVTPQLNRAKALLQVARPAPGAAAAAATIFEQMAADAKDVAASLYLGWAHAAAENYSKAIKAFDQAEKAGTDAIKLYAIYGRAEAKLAMLDLPGARVDYDAVYQLDKNHIGAMVGLAAALPVAQAQQQEKELSAIGARKDLATADPRAVRRLWTLSAQAAKRANRFDAAREAFRKALALEANDVGALTGLAEVEMLDGKLDGALAEITKALTIAPDDIRGQIVAAEISIRRRALRDAQARLDILEARKPVPSPGDLAKIKLVRGMWHDVQGDDDDAVRLYEEAAKLAGEADLAPTLAAVNKLTALANKAEAGKQEQRAADLRSRANGLLGSLAANAEKDPQLALTLGMAYLQAADPKNAEPWLRKVTEERPDDPEGQYQLGKTLARLKDYESAINWLTKAIEIAPKRPEIGIELALTYELADKLEEAAQTYSKLLANTPDPTIELRARAGRFFAKTGKIKEAVEQGEKIIAMDDKHPTGRYLRAEGLLAQDRAEEARALIGLALEAERDPYFLDCLGRAAEKMSEKEEVLQNTAITAWREAHAAEPKMFGPLAGLGRLYVKRNEMEKAAEVLKKAYEIRQDPDVAFNMGLAAKALQVKVSDTIYWFNQAKNGSNAAAAYWNLGQLYRNENKGKEAAAALDAATKILEDEERKLDKKPPKWALEAYFLRGQVHMDNGNLSGAKAAWSRFVNMPGASAMTAKYQEANRQLGTGLKNVP